MRSQQSPNCPAPPVCFLWRPCASAILRMVSRYGMRTATSFASTPACSCMRERSISTCVSPMAYRMVWWVWSSRRMRMVGSASAARARNVPSLSSSFLLTASMATGYSGSGSTGGSMAMSPSTDSVSPLRVSASLGTTTMSPAFALFTSIGSLPVITWIFPRRSFLPVRALTSSIPGSR